LVFFCSSISKAHIEQPFKTPTQRPEAPFFLKASFACRVGVSLVIHEIRVGGVAEKLFARDLSNQKAKRCLLLSVLRG
jgi:hypothetical protein